MIKFPHDYPYTILTKYSMYVCPCKSLPIIYPNNNGYNISAHCCASVITDALGDNKYQAGPSLS
jgi:hypothetical protein